MPASSLSLERAAGALTSSTAAAHITSTMLPGLDCKDTSFVWMLSIVHDLQPLSMAFWASGRSEKMDTAGPIEFQAGTLEPKERHVSFHEPDIPEEADSFPTHVNTCPPRCLTARERRPCDLAVTRSNGLTTISLRSIERISAMRIRSFSLCAVGEQSNATSIGNQSRWITAITVPFRHPGVLSLIRLLFSMSHHFQLRSVYAT